MLERLDSRTRGPQRHVTVAALLEQPGIARVKRLEARQGRQCIGNAVQVALADRNHVQRVPVLRHLCKQRLPGPQRRLELAAPQEFAHPTNLGLDAGGRRVEGGCVHRRMKCESGYHTRARSPGTLRD